jgi:SOS-response transcriptional repressor LexA
VSAQSQPESDADPPVYVITAAELRMRRVAGWIEQYRKTFGKGPRLTEIGAYVGFSSVATIFDLLTEMRELGFIQWEPRRQRTAAVLVGPTLGSARKPTQRARILRVVAEYRGQATSRQISARTGLSSETVATLLSLMTREGDVQRVSRAVYRLPRADVPA